MRLSEVLAAGHLGGLPLRLVCVVQGSQDSLQVVACRGESTADSV